MQIKQSNYRDIEIKNMFDIIFKSKISQGVNPVDARYLAIEAVILRFHLSEERVRKILYIHHKDKSCIFTILYSRNLDLISHFKTIIKTLEDLTIQYTNMLSDVSSNDIKHNLLSSIKELNTNINHYNNLVNIIEQTNEYYRTHN